MDYEIKQVSENLFFIRWHQSPQPTRLHTQFLQDMRRILDDARRPVYFISDLRKGRISNIETLLKLSNMAVHKNWGGGAAFSQDTASSVYVDVFSRFARQHGARDGVWDTFEEALAALSAWGAVVTDDIDWPSIFDAP